MTPEQLDILGQIKLLLREAYDDYFRRGDGHCKSSEGYIEVRYPTYFDKEFLSPAAVSLGIFSYVLGPSRMHDFDSFEQALEEVKKWHADQLASESDH